MVHLRGCSVRSALVASSVMAQFAHSSSSSAILAIDTEANFLPLGSCLPLGRSLAVFAVSQGFLPEDLGFGFLGDGQSLEKCPSPLQLKQVRVLEVCATLACSLPLPFHLPLLLPRGLGEPLEGCLVLGPLLRLDLSVLYPGVSLWSLELPRVCRI